MKTITWLSDIWPALRAAKAAWMLEIEFGDPPFIPGLEPWIDDDRIDGGELGSVNVLDVGSFGLDPTDLSSRSSDDGFSSLSLSRSEWLDKTPAKWKTEIIFFGFNHSFAVSSFHFQASTQMAKITEFERDMFLR